MANGTDGSVVIGFDANIGDAEKQLAKLKADIQKLEEELKFKNVRREGLFEQLKEIEAEADKARKRLRAMTENGGGLIYSEREVAQQRDTLKNLEKASSRVVSELEKADREINEGNIRLNYMKRRFGEVTQEAAKLREEESASANEGAEEQASALSKVRSAAAKHGASIGQSLKSAFSTGTKYARRFASFVGNLLKRFNLLSKFGHTFVPVLKRIYNLGRRVFFFSIITAGMRALRETTGELIKSNDKLIASFSQLKGVALTAFQPIYAYVMPALTAFIDTITVAVARLAQFTALLFGTTAEQAQKNAKALNAQAKATEAAGSAADEAAAGLAGFDEINQLSGGGKSGGGSGGTSEDAIPPVFDYDFGAVPEWIEKITDAIHRGDWGEAGGALADKLNELIDGVKWDTLGRTIGGKLQNALSFGLSLLRGINWGRLGGDLASMLNRVISSINAADVGAWLGQKLRIGIELAFGFVSTFDFAGAGNWLGNVLNGWVAEIDWAKLAQTISLGIQGIFTGFGNFLATVDWREVGRSIGDFIANIDWGGMLASIWTAAKEAVGALWETLEGMNEKLPGLKTLVLAIGAGFAAWKIGSGVMSILSLLGIGGKGAAVKGGGAAGGALGSIKGTLTSVADIAIIIGGAVAIIEALGLLMKVPGVQETAEQGLALLGTVFNGIASLALPLAGMAAAMVVLGKIGAATVALGLAGAAIVIDGIPAVLLALGALMSIPYLTEFTETGISVMKKAFEGIEAVALPLAGMAGALVVMGLATPLTMLSGLAGFAIVVGGVELVLAALGGLNQIPGFDWIVGEGGKVLMQLGDILGGFVGSIVGGLLDKVSDSFPNVADNLAQFSEKLKPFFENIKGADAASIDAVGHVAGIIMTLTAAGVLDGLTRWFTGGKNIVRFGEELEEFAPHFKNFYNEIKGVDPDVVNASAAAAQSVAEFARNIPNEGGVLAVLYGDNSLAEFGAMLPGFAKDFVAYYNEVKRVTDMSVVEKSAAAAKSISEFARNLPNTGGLVTWYTGDNRLDEFGAMLPGFGRDFAAYYNAVKGISQSVVDKSVAAAQSISAFATNLPNSGGFFSLFTGDNSLDKFGKQLAAFGGYFAEFYEYIKPMSPSKLEGMMAAINKTTDAAKATESVNKQSLIDYGAALRDFGSQITAVDWAASGNEFARCVDAISGAVVNVVTYVDNTFAVKWASVWVAAREKVDTESRDIIAKMGDIINKMGQIPTSVTITVAAAVSGALNNIQSVQKALAGLSSISLDIKTTGGSVKAGLNKKSSSKPSVISAYSALNLGGLPRLAQGMVIPPNREFAAILGDQTSGTNVEAPLDTIEQAVANAMRGSGGGDIHITLELDGAVVARKTVKHINDMTRQAGKPVLLY